MGPDEELSEPAQPRRPWRWWLAPLAVIAALLYPGGHVLLLDHLVELGLVVLIVHLVESRGELAEFFSAAPLAARRLGLVCVALFLFGHLWGSDEQTFPLTHWTMYTDPPEGDVVTYEYRGLTSSGEAIEFLPNARAQTLTTSLVTFGVAGRSGLLWEAEQLTVLLDDAEQQRRDFRKEHFEVLRTLARLHNEREGTAPISTIVVSRLALPREALGHPEQAKREVLWRIPVEAP
ncbi:MAG: hypothetical protein JKY65_00175 [Planctomycetes bacterium]|nr:hypothetical protein [Planctomycetota bacterium]